MKENERVTNNLKIPFKGGYEIKIVILDHIMQRISYNEPKNNIKYLDNCKICKDLKKYHIYANYQVEFKSH